jgi:outer membrane protein assembly factor BamA
MHLSPSRMKTPWVSSGNRAQGTLAGLVAVLLTLATPLAGCGLQDDDEKAAAELDVNSRYTVESVHFPGHSNLSISDPLRSELDKVVGAKYDRPTLERLADRLRSELRVTDVKVNATRGTEPDRVIVNFEVNSRSQKFDLNVAKFLYDSKEGWSGDGNATTYVKGNSFTFGLVSDGDSLVERYAGIRAKFERKHLGTDRLGFKFEFDSYHEMWNQATLDQAQPGDIYRSRQVFTPEATLVIAQPLEWSFGVSFARLRVPYSSSESSFDTGGGGAAAAKTESSNAVVNTLRYHQRWGSAHDPQEQEATAVYSVEAATSLLGTDRVFTRHMADVHYRIRHARNTMEIRFLAGLLNGNAPLYERFVLGDSTTLRGWNRFQLDPVGGSHVLYGSIDYRYRVLQVFYDTGAIWDRTQDREQKQSVGVGFRKDLTEKESFQLAVAFPLRAGHVDPIMYAGMSF